MSANDDKLLDHVGAHGMWESIEVSTRDCLVLSWSFGRYTAFRARIRIL